MATRGTPNYNQLIVVSAPQGGPYTVKERLAIFPSQAGMSLTKLSLTGNNLIISGQEEFGK
jgi:hypothetical protein